MFDAPTPLSHRSLLKSVPWKLKTGTSLVPLANQRLEMALVKQILMRPMGYLGFEPILCQRLHDLKLVKSVVDAFYV